MIRRIPVVCVVFGMLLSETATATAQTQSDLETLDAFTQRMHGYGADLLELN